MVGSGKKLMASPGLLFIIHTYYMLHVLRMRMLELNVGVKLITKG